VFGQARVLSRVVISDIYSDENESANSAKCHQKCTTWPDMKDRKISHAICSSSFRAEPSQQAHILKGFEISKELPGCCKYQCCDRLL